MKVDSIVPEELEEELLKNMSEDERIAYLLNIDNEEHQVAAFVILSGLCSSWSEKESLYLKLKENGITIQSALRTTEDGRQITAQVRLVKLSDPSDQNSAERYSKWFSAPSSRNDSKNVDTMMEDSIKNMTEDERIAYLLQIDGVERQINALKIIQGFLSTEEALSLFDNKLSAAINLKAAAKVGGAEMVVDTHLNRSDKNKLLSKSLRHALSGGEAGAEAALLVLNNKAPTDNGPINNAGQIKEEAKIKLETAGAVLDNKDEVVDSAESEKNDTEGKIDTAENAKGDIINVAYKDERTAESNIKATAEVKSNATNTPPPDDSNKAKAEQPTQIVQSFRSIFGAKPATAPVVTPTPTALVAEPAPQPVAEQQDNTGPRPVPDLAEALPIAMARAINAPMKFRGPFARYAKEMDEANLDQLHDLGSSVPYRGQVFTHGQPAFAIEQAEKLDALLKTRNISPNNASIPDKKIFQRAEAARKEQKLQALARSEFDMKKSEENLDNAIRKLKEGSLLSAIPGMMAAGTPDEAKQIYNDAIVSGLINREAVHDDMRDIGKHFMAHEKATEKHVSNLIKDGQEDVAHEVVGQWQEKHKAIKDDGLLNSIHAGFGKKIDEMSKKMSEMVSNLIQSLMSKFASPSPS